MAAFSATANLQTAASVWLAFSLWLAWPEPWMQRMGTSLSMVFGPQGAVEAPLDSPLARSVLRGVQKPPKPGVLCFESQSLPPFSCHPDKQDASDFWAVRMCSLWLLSTVHEVIISKLKMLCSCSFLEVGQARERRSEQSCGLH